MRVTRASRSWSSAVPYCFTASAAALRLSSKSLGLEMVWARPGRAAAASRRMTRTYRIFMAFPSKQSKSTLSRQAPSREQGFGREKSRGRCGSFPRMSDLTIEVSTAKSSMEEVRPALDAGLKREFPGGMLKWRWEGDVMHLSGPGATATIALEDGRLVGRAHLKPPASLMKPVIEQKISSVMKTAAVS